VDLKHLLEDLRDAYDGSLEETILTEITAAALDRGAARIRLLPDPAGRTLLVTDDGRGMTRRDVVRCHRIVPRAKAREEQAAFTGVGIKLALLVAEEVAIETRRGAAALATTWRLETRHRAPWEWTEPAGFAGERGTAVRLRMSNPLSPLLDTGYLEEVLRKHFAPLLDEAYAGLLRRRYPRGVVFDVSGKPLEPARPGLIDRATIPIRMGRRRLPSAIAIVQRHDHSLPEDQQGIAVSVRGKVIRRGWDWLGLSPANAWRVTGLVEAPELASSTLPGGNDFIRSGPRARAYLTYRKAIRDVVARQLAEWGDSREGEASRVALPLEPGLERVLADLASRFPRLRTLDGTAREEPHLPAPLFAEAVSAGEVTDPTPPRCGLLVQFESRPDDTALGRLVDSTLWINDAHPAFARAAAARAGSYHNALAVALTLAPHVADDAGAHAFITQFLAQWGAAGSPARPRRRRVAGRRPPGAARSR
jgi:hypothetical protein